MTYMRGLEKMFHTMEADVSQFQRQINNDSRTEWEGN